MTEAKLKTPDVLTLEQQQRWHKENLPPRSPRTEDPINYNERDYRPNGTLLGGIFWMNPFTDVGDTMITFQGKEPCDKIEFNMLECVEAYGMPRANDKCRDYMDDFNECSNEHKQFQRLRLMRAERARQHRMGERKIKYAMPPRIGSYEY